MLGIPEATLRSWHRRYDVGPHAIRPGGYRRYSAEDVVRLETMRDLIRSGMLASDAARTVGGRSADRLRHVRVRLAEAARGLDSRACRALVAESIEAFGVVTAWDQLCRPALLDVEAEQLAARVPETCIPQEHVLSWGIAAALHQVLAVTADGRPPAVMLACTGAEQHTLPLEVLAAALAERQVPVRMLGAAVPAVSLVAAVRATTPEVVVLWAQRPESADSDALGKLRHLPPRHMTAGPGWSPRRRAGGDHLSDLSGALAALSA